MFDLTSSKLLILGVVALIVVGPKELPFLLRTVGKYMAMIRRQANEFRSQFDDAMREAELDSLKKDVENVARDAETSLRATEDSLHSELHETEKAVADATKVEPQHTFDPVNGLDTSLPTTSAPMAADAKHTDTKPADAPALAKTGS